jgi:two-component system chemotaxis response regulator CheY
VVQTDRVRVVLIDDDDMMRAVMRAALSADVFDIVEEAGSGRSGLEACLRSMPDLIFLDVTMPDMNGLEILPAIRAGLPDAEVLMVTASSDRQTIEQAIFGGAVGYIVKPLTAGKIDDALRRPVATIRRKRAAQVIASGTEP